MDGATAVQASAAQAAMLESWYGKFVPGRIRSGSVEDKEFLARRGSTAFEPWSKFRSVTDSWLSPGQKIYMINGEDKPPGGSATNKRCTSLAEARKELSLLERFTVGKGKLVTQEYTVTTPIPVRQGWAGPLQDMPGGGFQWEILADFRDNAWTKYLTTAIEYKLNP